ncbi:AAA family ATPase [uncultured Adlercreutzia sp.]|uniref:AAA family ATPase n=1 Tax=uncultured Adlercreutzia sp. TaxID=875803 RepID=UPI0026658AAC|nr:AAA family ATPase [uncultured Adlercreutzia sp.]
MSDGERSVLYLAAQVLCVPENKTLIIDEPEVHLHPSLMGRLWRALESARPDCLFVFITHDVQFAALHKDSPRIWVKSFDGANWDWDFIPNSDLPEQLLLELLGNRKKRSLR